MGKRASETPGLRIRIRRRGDTAAYWVARADLIKKGYRPKLVILTGLPEELLHARCRELQKEMLLWANDDGPGGGRNAYTGTLESLVRLYMTDRDSPYFELRNATQNSYRKVLQKWSERYGPRQIAKITGADVKRWWRDMIDSGIGLNTAHLRVKILKAALAFGSSRRYVACTQLRAELRDVRFETGEARRVYITWEQLCAFRDAAHASGCHSMALGVTLQYDLALRQRDVIGEWVGEEGGRRWQDGLTWGDIASGILTRKTSKTGAMVRQQISDYPDLEAELARVPLERRVGPIVVNEKTGLPYAANTYRDRFRIIARKSGIPDDIWNMDNRASAVTESYEAGSTTEDAMALAGHTQASTNRRYLRDTHKQTSRVAQMRVRSRKE